MKKHTIIWEDNAFTVYFFGEITLKDLFAANNELTSNSRLDSTTHYYFDFCNVSQLNLSKRDLQVYAKYDSVMPRFIRRSRMRGAFRVASSAMREVWNEFLEQGHQAWPRKVFCSSIIAETWVQDVGCIHEHFEMNRMQYKSATA
ncbi:MAG: hypothetical protein ISR41_07000 [Puniceicoccaceae bacterium]|nr:hypothetical protein [Puniceicoccaceae bacterium]